MSVTSHSPPLQCACVRDLPASSPSPPPFYRPVCVRAHFVEGSVGIKYLEHLPVQRPSAFGSTSRATVSQVL